MTTPEDKYIVIKIADWDRFELALDEDIQLPVIVEDAVVIRRQDIFAAPALHGYANAISVALEFLEQGPDRDRLLRLSDFFHHQAMLAEQTDYRKIPD